MPGNEEAAFSSKTKYSGIFLFEEFYKFCYDWLKEEVGLTVIEKKYSEKLVGDAKNIDVEWEATKKVTDYFKFKIEIKFKITNLTKVEISQAGQKISTNKGSVEMSIKGILVRDYEGKFERTAFRKFWRDVYEKWVINSRIEELKDKLTGACDEFLAQAKAWLDLEGKR